MQKGNVKESEDLFCDWFPELRQLYFLNENHMRQYNIFSKDLVGPIKVLYNDQSILTKIDMNSAKMSAGQTNTFLHKIPILESSLAGAFTDKVTVVETEYKISFDDFWDAYAKKINRPRSEKVWEKMSLQEKINAVEGIQPYDRFLQKNDRKKCDPENYLKNKMWENEWK